MWHVCHRACAEIRKEITRVRPLCFRLPDFDDTGRWHAVIWLKMAIVELSNLARTS